jgi:predicted transcriptional regulator
MTRKTTVDPEGLSTEQIDAIEHFEADYNAVDKHLRKDLGFDSAQSFTALVKEYARRHIGWRDADLLATISDVRNAIVHGKTEAYRYVAVPTPSIARQLRACRDRLTNPERVIPKFQRNVQVVSSEDTLARVLGVIAQRDYSQFPVYDAGAFRGLITENGITRWLAQHVSTKLSLVELEDVHVREILLNEESRRNYHFVPRNTRVDDTRGVFAAHPLLEAVLITASGKDSERLLGIATRWDITNLG